MLINLVEFHKKFYRVWSCCSTYLMVESLVEVKSKHFDFLWAVLVVDKHVELCVVKLNNTDERKSAGSCQIIKRSIKKL